MRARAESRPPTVHAALITRCPMNASDPLVEQAEADFARAATPAELENAKARFLGRTGLVTEQLKGLAKLAPDEKKTRGASINASKQRIEAALAARREAMANAE